jgi:hypothetical protein
MTKPRATVGEMMDRFRSDPAWVAARQAEDRRRATWVAQLRLEQLPLVAALRSVGIAVDSVWDLVNTGKPYPEAIPVLLEHLGKPYHPRNREGIVRALSVKEARAAAWEPLLKEYEKQPGDEEPLPPEMRGLKDALASAVSFLAGRQRIPEMLRLARDRRHGPSRVFFVEDLGKVGDQTAIPVLEELCNDPEVRECAQKALKKLSQRLRRA